MHEITQKEIYERNVANFRFDLTHAMNGSALSVKEQLTVLEGLVIDMAKWIKETKSET